MRGKSAMKILRRLLSTVNCQLLTVIFLFSLFTLTLTLVSPHTVHAQNCEPGTPPTDAEAIDKINKCAIERNVFDDKIFNLNQIAGTTDSLYNLLTGVSSLHPETNKITQNTGALAASGNLVAAMYSTPPVSGVQYFAQKIRDVNPVKPAYAQQGTIGFDALKPVQEVWTVFRNISYIGFVLVFVIMGFMIMFRAHISPQAVATVQDSVPRIVIALVLVTFSYALAGLMIDIMFLLLNVIIRALEATPLLDNGQYVFEKNVFSVITGSWKNVFVSVFDAVKGQIDQVLDLPLKLDKLFGFFGGTIAGLVIGIALLFIMFRIFLMLLMAYAMIILLTMAAPFFFLIQALPGRNGAGEWFKQMASNVAAFQTVALMFIFAGILGGIEELGGSGAGAIQHGQVNQFPLFAAGIDTQVIGFLIGIGFLLLTPSAAELVKNAIGAKGPQMGAGIGASLGAGAGVVGAGARAGAGYAYPGSPVGKFFRGRKAQEEEKFQESTNTGMYSKEQTAYRENIAKIAKKP